MTQDEIIRSPLGREQLVALAREAGVWDEIGYPKCIERFAALVAAHEREACAKVCEKVDLGKKFFSEPVALECAAAIRSRSSEH